MAAYILLAVCLVAVASACDICGDPNHQQMSSWQQGQGKQQQQQQQQTSMMMMMMMNQMMQQKQWGNNNVNPSYPSVPSGGHSGGSVTPTRPNNDGCQGFADVVFLLDSSASINNANFQKQLAFVADLVGNFQLARNGRDGYQFSVVSFSTTVKEEFNLKQYKTMGGLQTAIRGISYMEQSTYTHAGLKFIRDSSFLSKNGGRYGAVKIVIVMTDGQSVDGQVTSEEAAELRKYGALLLAIGIGDDIDPTELQALTSSNDNVFRVNNFDVLGTIKDQVENRACEITIQEGGGSNGTRNEFSWEAYLQWCTQQQMMKGEQKIAEDILKSMEDFKVGEKKEDETKIKEKHEKEKIINMAEEVQRMEKYMASTENIGHKLVEMKHHYMYLVTSEMIKFCPMEGMESDVMRFLWHGDTKWSPGRSDQCDVEDMPKIDTVMDSLDQSQSAAQWAQQIANLNKTQQVQVFFSGAKDSICDSLKTYVAQVKVWEDSYPQMKRLLGIMF